MNATKEEIVKLRKASGQPIMDCKEALLKAKSFDQAFDILRHQASEKIDESRKNKKSEAGRVIVKGTHEHLVPNSEVVIASLLCETDFTANCDEFAQALEEIADILLKELEDGDTKKIREIENRLKSQTGEKIELGDYHLIRIKDDAPLMSYVHFDNKKAAIVQFRAASNPWQLQELGRNIAMHVVAFRPKYLDKEEFRKDTIKPIVMPKGLDEKPPEIRVKIVEGVVAKYMKETVLTEQPYCLDDKKSVGQVIKEMRHQLGMEIELIKFRHIEI